MWKSLGVLMVFVALATACAGTFFSGSPTTQQVLTKIAIQQATVRAIQAGHDRAARAAAVVAIVDEALVAVQASGDVVVTVEQLRTALELVLPKDLSPADKLLAAQLTELLVAEVNARVPAGQHELPVAEISAVLGWVREAAQLLVQA